MAIIIFGGSSFPSSLDAYAHVTDFLDEVTADQMNSVTDALENIEAKVGVDGSAVATTFDYILKHGRHSSSQTGGDSGSIAYVLDTDNAHLGSDALLVLRSDGSERVRFGGGGADDTFLQLGPGEGAAVSAADTMAFAYDNVGHRPLVSVDGGAWAELLTSAALTLQVAYDAGEQVTTDAQGALDIIRGADTPDAQGALFVTDANAEPGRTGPLVYLEDGNVGTTGATLRCVRTVAGANGRLESPLVAGPILQFYSSKVAAGSDFAANVTGSANVAAGPVEGQVFGVESEITDATVGAAHARINLRTIGAGTLRTPLRIYSPAGQCYFQNGYDPGTGGTCFLFTTPSDVASNEYVVSVEDAAATPGGGATLFSVSGAGGVSATGSVTGASYNVGGTQVISASTGATFYAVSTVRVAPGATALTLFASPATAGDDSSALSFQGSVVGNALRSVYLLNECDSGTDTYRLRINDNGGVQLASLDESSVFTLRRTTTGVLGAEFQLYQDKASPTSSDYQKLAAYANVGVASAKAEYAGIYLALTDPTATGSDGAIRLYATKTGQLARIVAFESHASVATDAPLRMTTMCAAGANGAFNLSTGTAAFSAGQPVLRVYTNLLGEIPFSLDGDADTTWTATGALTTGPELQAYLNRATAGAAGHVCGLVTFYGKNDAAPTPEKTYYAGLKGVIAAAADGAEYGAVTVNVMDNAVAKDILTLRSNGVGTAVIQSPKTMTSGSAAILISVMDLVESNEYVLFVEDGAATGPGGGVTLFFLAGDGTLHSPYGSATAPNYSTTASADTGLYFSSATAGGIALDGTAVLDWTASVVTETFVDTGATGPEFALYQNSSSPAGDSVQGNNSGDNVGLLSFYGMNNAGSPEKTLFAQVQGHLAAVADGAEYGALNLRAVNNGSVVTLIQLIGDGANGAVLCNYKGATTTPPFRIRAYSTFTVAQPLLYIENNAGTGLPFQFYAQGDIWATSTETGATGVEYRFCHNSANPATGDVVGLVSFYGRDSDDTSPTTRWVHIDGVVRDVTAANKAGRVDISGYASDGSGTADTRWLSIYGLADTGTESGVVFENYLAAADAGANRQFTFYLDDNAATMGPVLALYRWTDDPANGDDVGCLQFEGANGLSPVKAIYGQFLMEVTNYSEQATVSEGQFVWRTDQSGSLADAMVLTAAGELSIKTAGTHTAAQVDLLDDFDDAMVLREHVYPESRRYTQESLDKLCDMGIFQKQRRGDGYLANVQAMFGLVGGGVYQTRQRVDRLDTRMDRLEEENRSLAIENAELRHRVGELEARLQ